MTRAEQIDKIISDTQGTCNPLDEAIQYHLGENEDEESLTDDERQQIDMEIFNCATCGWWYEICEQSEDGETCTDCKECEDETEEE